MIEDNGNYVLVMTIIVTVLTGLIIAFVALGKKKQEELYLKLITQRSEHEKAMMAAQLQIQELTFKLISHEIHDNVNHLLVNSKAQLDTIRLRNDQESENKIRSSSALIEKSIRILANISEALNSDKINDIGLMNALKTEIHRINAARLFSVKTRFSGKIRTLNSYNELQLFRIVQEAFTNIIKHSRADTVYLIVDYRPDHIRLVVKDNGTGFYYIPDSNTIRGAGLRTMKLRASVLKGEIDIQSIPNQGTIIRVLVPYNDVSNTQLITHTT